MADAIETQDKICRSLGILKSAKMISCSEAMELLSYVRFGVITGIIETVAIDDIDSIISDIQPATMMVAKGEKLSEKARDIERAELIKSRI
jgi:protein arginine kinase